MDKLLGPVPDTILRLLFTARSTLFCLIRTNLHLTILTGLRYLTQSVCDWLNGLVVF